MLKEKQAYNSPGITSDMRDLTKYHADITVLSIIDNVWMIKHVPAEATHRICISFTKNGTDYVWDQVYNDKVISLQDMIKRAVQAIKRAA